jgi:hypothetical protein
MRNHLRTGRNMSRKVLAIFAIKQSCAQEIAPSVTPQVVKNLRVNAARHLIEWDDGEKRWGGGTNPLVPQRLNDPTTLISRARNKGLARTGGEPMRG